MMKKHIYLFSIALLSLKACSDPVPEEKAAIVGGRDYTFCSCCGGRFVEVDSMRFRADLPAEFDQDSTPVWLRYEQDQRPGYSDCRWIKVKSIRKR